MSQPTLDALQACPAPSERRVAVRATAAAERLLRQGHPWLYDQSIRRQSHEGCSGDLAVIFDRRGRFLGIGLYDPTSPIRVRVLQHRRPSPIDQAWYAARLAAAIRRRAPLVSSQTTGYRLVHGENDGLPGLVIDRYDQTLVLKLYSSAWVPHLRAVRSALADVALFKRLILRLSRAAQQHPRHLQGLRDGLVLAGPPLKGPLLFTEHGLRFEVDPVRGQKTGFFLDQRENRARIERLSAGRSVLDGFACTGGFSVCAARGGARNVVSVDISRPALEAARRNLGLNRHHPSVARAVHRVIVGDAFETLHRLRTARHYFDLVILDPPSFAKRTDEVPTALAAYHRLIRLGLVVLSPGGILAVSCCSSQLSAEAFFAAAHRAAAAVGRPLRELERTTHPLDHPIGFREGAYLKCLFAFAPAPRTRAAH